MLRVISSHIVGISALKRRRPIPNMHTTPMEIFGLEISYNLLNLPTSLFCWGDYAEYYDYLADGTKVRHAYQDGQKRIYAGSLVYDQGVFESAPFGGGRIVGTDNGSEVHYFLTDHLGSVRVVAKVTTAGRDDLDRKDYYPFGKEWAQSDMPISENRYTFSGKEQVDVAIEDGITTPIHDFGARYYDSDGVLFFQQDPLMEKYYSIGQYNYCAGYCFSSRTRLWKSIIPSGSTTTVREIRLTESIIMAI